MSKRNYPLDYIRGLLALLIVCYHFTVWAKWPINMSSPLSRVGIYGVAAFYILSGLTHFMVYKDKFLFEKQYIKSFFIKRFIRIMPVLWLATGLTLLIKFKPVDFEKLFLNITGLFGFIKPDGYMATGAWSVGNELVYYLLFPLAIILYRFSYKYLYALGFFAFIYSIFIMTAFLNINIGLGQQWAIYIHPLNNFFLFVFGMIIVDLKERTLIKSFSIFNYYYLLLIALVLLFTFYPVAGDSVNIVSGVNRFVFSMITFLIFSILYVKDFVLPKYIHQPLVFLATTSYSIYLLHPICYMVISQINFNYKLKFGIISVLVATFILTIPVAYLSNKFIEQKFGQWLNKKVNN